VLSEVRELEQRYAISGFETVDNILDMGYFRSVLPELAGDGTPRRIFYEVKANLKRAQVKELAESGITWIQPGIESLHSGVLRLMDKGVQGWQNVQLLRFAREFGVRMSWGMLWGFPGEEDHWYAQVACWIPLLEHLQSPSGLIRLRYDRYSVYHNQARERGLRLQPIPALRFVYPLPPEELEDLAYFFIAEGGPDAFGLVGAYTDILSQRPGLAAVLEAVTAWRRAFWRPLPPVLAMSDDGEAVEVLDTRGCARAVRTRLTGVERDLLLACDDAPGVDRLASVVAASEGELARAVAELKRLGFVVEIDRRLVALPVRGNLPELPRREDFPGGFVEDRPVAPAPAYAEA
jgi:ribosomal peptide maturation radical SAM protein 1